MIHSAWLKNDSFFSFESGLLNTGHLILQKISVRGTECYVKIHEHLGPWSFLKLLNVQPTFIKKIVCFHSAGSYQRDFRNYLKDFYFFRFYFVFFFVKHYDFVYSNRPDCIEQEYVILFYIFLNQIIELTLYKYQNFLDFLRNAGFGKLIEIGEMDQKQEQSKKQSKSSSGRSQASKDHPNSLSPPPGNNKLTDQQKYYLDKINRTKNKMNRNVMESTQVSTVSNTKSSKMSKHSSKIDMFDEAGFSIVGDLENHHIDTLLPNALEISRSYRDRLNSSSVNSSMVFNNTSNNYTTNNSKKRLANEMILSGIKEISGSQAEGFIDDSALLEVTASKSTKQLSRTKYRENKSVISSIEEVPNDTNEFKTNSQINQSAESNSNKQAEFKKVSNNSNHSTVSPATTVIANNAPAVSVRKSIQASKSSQSDELDDRNKKGFLFFLGFQNWKKLKNF